MESLLCCVQSSSVIAFWPYFWVETEQSLGLYTISYVNVYARKISVRGQKKMGVV